MATLKIRKSENEILELPLTTEKPIARSLAIFQDGKVYYCPLVHSGEYLDSGVKVRIDGNTYALANEIYDPVVYDPQGRSWGATGSPKVYERSKLLLNGMSFLRYIRSISLSSSSIFRISFQFTPTVVRGNSQILFQFSASSSTYIHLNFDTSRKMNLRMNATTLKTSSALTLGVTYRVMVQYSAGKFDFTIDGSSVGTVSKNITSAAYLLELFGDDDYPDHRYELIGQISNLEVFLPGDTGTATLRFGD